MAQPGFQAERFWRLIGALTISDAARTATFYLKITLLKRESERSRFLRLRKFTDSTSPATSRPVTPVVSTQCTSMPMDIDSEETVVVQKTPDKSRQQTVTQSPILLNKGDIDIEQFIPQYSTAIQFLLDSGDILKDWNKFIEETAYHILSKTNIIFNTRDIYGQLGRVL
ncbi:Hypothetical predicted protein [Mytilus galloprovincialis]|uniref:Uncharacterized protein n=1 Tax=Mytilus galloprovincialis TaxID=29158 RepID=A0A8B6FC48_MYTGA|nr:Hypothetical predicted protein [Mytilus galloprovincialis]